MRKNSAESAAMGSGGEGISSDLDAVEKGRVLHNRRLAAGIKSVNQFAQLSGVHRDTVGKAERGEATDSTYERLDAWLDQYTGEPPASSTETIEFTVEGDFGVKVTVKGPISNHELLRADVAEIIRSIRES